ncbi:CoA-binding protein [Pseudothermotoga thermarum]|uniref:CoA-binding domain protein n=1 Tax=Pseudothermotoga thermarum DSM 5069 TaxID=688269 RepID=F7YTQ7_9THEM|nr:CoA-binding protein [Pseudothermotoga thermarum]AEH51285.1 CoA-binding domain protein [Pseudothermotoga thermarum DSM 5069]
MNPKEFKKIAVIGASRNREKYGNKIVRDLASKGFEVYPVNAYADEIEGMKCFKSLEELPKEVELLVFVIPPDQGFQEVQKAVELGFRRFWFQPGAGSKEIENFLKSRNIQYAMGRCIMVETSF